MKRSISPSILSSDFGTIRQTIEMLNRSEADMIHLDVMDGVFVPNITFGFQMIRHIKKIASKPLDVHLMIVQPERYISEFIDSGADYLSIHYENNVHLNRSLELIKSKGIKAGIVINPHTAVFLLENIVNLADLVCIMAVNPGFGGQKFIPGTYEKIRSLKTIISEKRCDTLIEVDGGVDISNAAKLYESGADILVAGNAVFSSDDPAGMIRKIKSGKNL